MEIRQNVNLYESAENTQSPEETANEQGKILRVKQGYNPNSSSIGSIVFVMPAALLGITAAFGLVSSVIMSTLMTDREKGMKNINTPPEGADDE